MEVTSTTPQDNDIKIRLIQILSGICTARNISPCSEPASWPSTRDIADACDVNIYRARYFLLKLVAENQVETTTELVEKKRRWRIRAN
ncbi:TPA: FaeA/PapI family transcriptional regulator [Serratia fonticola]